MTKWQAIIFDLDDTLYPEESYVRSGFLAVATWVEQYIGLPMQQSVDELGELFARGVKRNTFNLWLSTHSLPEEYVPQLVHVYREHTPNIAVFPEVPHLLHNLRQSYILGLLTDGYLQSQRLKVASLGITPFFDAIVFSDELGTNAWKPSTIPFQVALSRLGDIPPSRAVYVGDNPLKDFLGARQLGLTTVRVRREDGVYYSTESPSLEYAPHVTISNLTELESILAQEANRC